MRLIISVISVMRLIISVISVIISVMRLIIIHRTPDCDYDIRGPFLYGWFRQPIFHAVVDDR